MQTDLATVIAADLLQVAVAAVAVLLFAFVARVRRPSPFHGSFGVCLPGVAFYLFDIAAHAFGPPVKTEVAERCSRLSVILSRC